MVEYMYLGGAPDRETREGGGSQRWTSALRVTGYWAVCGALSVCNSKWDRGKVSKGIF